MACRSVMILLGLLWMVGVFQPTLVTSNSVSVYAPTNASVSIPCHVKVSQSVQWWYQRSHGSEAVELSANGQIFAEQKQRYRLDTPSLGQYDLVINSATINDTGLYSCIEENGAGVQHPSVWLVIKEPIPLTTIQSTVEVSDYGSTHQSQTPIILVSGLAAVLALCLIVVSITAGFTIRRARRRQLAADHERYDERPFIHADSANFWPKAAKQVERGRKCVQMDCATENMSCLLSSLTSQPKECRTLVKWLAKHIRKLDKPVGVIMAAEPHLSMIGPLVAKKLRLPFYRIGNIVDVTGQQVGEEYNTASGQAVRIEVHTDSLRRVQSSRAVLFVDECVTDGIPVVTGSLNLVRQLQMTVAEVIVLVGRQADKVLEDLQERTGVNAFCVIEVSPRDAVQADNGDIVRV